MSETVNAGELVLPRSLVEAYKAVRAQDGGGSRVPVFLDFSPAIDERVKCPNCGGVKGRGQLYAPVGPPTRPHWCGGEQHRREFRAFPCPVCADRRYRDTLRARCGVLLPEMVAKAEVWEVPGREQLVAAVDRAVSQWTAPSGPAGWLTLVGPYGSGKTFLAQRAVARLVEANVEAVYVQAHELGRAIMDAISSEASPGQVVERYRRVPVLVIDQIDWLRQSTASGNMTYVLEELINLLDDRYLNRSHRATVLIVNREWWRAGGGALAPILSRATEGTVAETDVPNLREYVGEHLRGEVT